MPNDLPSHVVDERMSTSFKIAIALNVAIVALQAIYGFLSHSIALIADAGHNFTDVLALVLALGANLLAARPPTKYRTYGYRRTTILAALLNAVLLLVTTGAIIFGAVHRLEHPSPVDGATVSIVAGIGIVLNLVSALLFRRGSESDLNVKAAFLHMAGDAAVSAGVVIAGLAIIWTGALWIDPIMSIVISVVILVSTWQVLRESVNLAADAVPESIDPETIERYLTSVDGVAAVHDLHIWGMSTTHTVLTAHLVVPQREVQDRMLFGICEELKSRFGIAHATLQVERGSAACALEASHVI